MPSPIPGLDVREFSNVDIPKSYVPPKVDPSTGGYAGRAPGPAAAPTAPAAAPTTPTNPQTGWFKRTAGALRSPSAEGVGRALGKVGRVAGPAAAGFAAGKELGTYQIDDPEVDSSVAGTMSALRQGNFGAAGRSLSKGALEATMDLGGIAASAVDAVNPFGSPAKEAYERGLRNTFGGQLRINGQSAPLATAPTAAGPDPRLQNPGRGVGFDDPRRLDMDNTRGTLRESRNFAPELASVPAQLPDNLREGVVFKTKDASGRTVYSGKNIKGDIQLVDGLGATQASRGASSVVPAGPATGLSGAGQGVATGGALAASQQPVQTEPTGFNTGRNGNAFVRSPEQQRADAETQASSIDPRTRELGLRTMDSLDKSDAAQLASETAKFNARTAAGASRYAADRGLEGNLAQAQATGLRYGYDQRLKASQMAIQAQAMQMAGGDTRKAAQLILQMGGDPSNLIQAATAFQGIDGKNRDDAEAYLDSVSTILDKDGKPVINPALRAQNAQMLNTVTGGKWAMADATERAKLAPDAIAGLRLVQGMNQYKDAGWGNLLNSDKPAYAGLPQNLAGGRLERVGLGEGAVSKDISRGDYVLRTPDGQEIYVPQSAVDGTTLRMLEKRGVTLKLD